MVLGVLGVVGPQIRRTHRVVGEGDDSGLAGAVLAGRDGLVR
jgi:hypothetical protein